MTNIIGEMELKRISWTYKETTDLLEYCKANNVGKLMAHTQKKNNKKIIYQGMFNEMIRLGYDKTLEQVEIKFKNLYQKYRKGLPDNPSMQINKKRFELWTLMHDVFKYGPIGRSTKPDKEKEIVPALNKTVKKEPDVNEILHESKKNSFATDPLENIEMLEPKSLKERVEQNTLRLKQEVDLQECGNIKYFRKPPTKADRSTANYLRCVRYLVEKFKTAQEELQNKFYIQQLKLQQQQQEWEEKILDEEREFFVKILRQSEAKARKNSQDTEIKEEDEDEDEMMQ